MLNLKLFRSDKSFIPIHEMCQRGGGLDLAYERAIFFRSPWINFAPHEIILCKIYKSPHLVFKIHTIRPHPTTRKGK